MNAPLRILAPAKVNLFLHVTGLQDDGYHTLQSLVGFTDFGDYITIEPADSFCFEITGPYANAFSEQEKSTGPDSKNLAVKAAYILSNHVKEPLRVKITLEKHLPLAAGIGGGTSDAAAVIRGLMRHWDLIDSWGLPKISDFMEGFTAVLGADFPICFHAQTAHISGIGDIIEPVTMPQLPIVLVNPGTSCPTRDIFMRLRKNFVPEQAFEEHFGDFQHLLETLNHTHNSLEPPATALIPEIENVLSALKHSKDCRISRMSGSGATCFGLFKTAEQAAQAGKDIQAQNPDWWVQSGILNI